ncbi:MAG: tetratricopeptide repeat protein, partial [Thermoanaerobaculia bacterium]
GSSTRAEAAAPAVGRTAVAVLPFANLTADPENAYLGDGVAEDLLTELSRIGTLKVVSRTSAMRFRNRDRSIGEIAKALHADVLVEGSVRRVGERVRIAARVVNARNDEQLWADACEGDLSNIFALQKDLALHVAAALAPEMSSGERAGVGQPATANVEAYRLYLQGRHCLLRMTEEGLRQAIEYYERAVVEDPHYALPHAGIGFAYMVLGMGHGAGTIPQREAQTRARQAIDRALAIDSSLPQALATDAALRFMFDFDWAGAEAGLEKALVLGRDSAETYGVYGLLLGALGRCDEAVAAQRQAHELDPLHPVVMSDIASALLRAGRFDEALVQAAELCRLEPAFPMAHSTMGWAYIKKGRYEEGLSALEEAVRVSPGNTVFLGQLGQAYAVGGRTGKAREILENLLALGTERYVTPYHLAYVYTGLGEHDRAIDCLERAVDERAGGVYGIKASFLFTDLRTHPRFIALLKRMHLATDVLCGTDDRSTR